MLVRDLMTTNVTSVPPDTPASAIVHLLAERGISGVPVVDSGGALLGVVTEGDLLRRLALSDEPENGWFRAMLADKEGAAERYASAHGSTARDVMTAAPVTVEEDDAAEHAARLIEEHKVRRLPVLRDGRLIGVVSRSDLLRALLTPPPERAAAATSDRAIRGAIMVRMRQEVWADPPHLSFDVTGGVVEFRGFLGSDATRRALSALAEGVPGVVRVVNRGEGIPASNVGLM